MRFKSRIRPLFILLGIAAFFGIGFIVMELWNNILPAVLHVAAITYWQAMGIFILCKILFGFGKGARGGAPWMRHRMAERFRNMTPEDKERFKEQMREHCGGRRGWGHHDHRHPFEPEWDKSAAEEAKPTE